MDREIACVTFDRCLIDKLDISETDEDSQKVFSMLLKGEHEEIIKLPAVQSLLDIASNDQDLSSNLQKNAELYVQQCGNEENSSSFLLGVAICSLQLFVQQNWTGPFTKARPVELLPTSMKERTKLKDEVLDGLTVDGESVYSLADQLVFLFIARCLLLGCRELVQHCQTSKWWLMRTLHIQQVILDERSPSIKETVEQLIDEISKIEPLMTDNKYRNAAIEFHLEAGWLKNFFYNNKEAKVHFQTSQKLAALKVELTGAMGKRTRYQQKELSQLVLQVQRENPADEARSNDQPQIEAVKENKDLFPKNISMDDDTVLENMALSEDPEKVHLSSVEQAIILSLCNMHRKLVEGQGDIVMEETNAYLEYILNEPKDWCVRSAALLKRAHIEKGSTRRLQRSLSQYEELISQCQRASPPASQRLPLVYSSGLPPHWKIQKDLASLFEELDAINAALEVYERLQMWEEVIKCYCLLGRREKAEKLIRQEMEKKETPALYCYLGDVTNDPSHYETAWEMSNSRSARAQRSLGRHYLALNEYEKALPHFEKSLELNSLQWGVWFTYGCSALACQSFDKAIKAFRRCVTLDGESYEAWNNLASALIRNNQKPVAFATLQEAIKCDYENWRIWENLSIVGVDIGEFSEVIRAYHRLLDIKHKWEDAEVLGILVRAVNESLPDSKDQNSAVLRPKLQELFGRVTSSVTGNADIWRQYADLLTGGNREPSQTDMERAVQYLQKCHRCSTQALNWEREVKKCQDVATQAASIAKVYVKCSEKMEDNSKAVQMLGGARLMLKGVLAKIKQKHTDSITEELHPDLVECCQDLDEQLQVIVETIDELRRS